MWDYSEKVMEHYRNPKNVGCIEDATVVGEAGSLTCGDMLKIYIKLDENNIITDAKFQTFGCGSAVASSSVLTEMIIGKSLEEAKRITNKDIADALGGLPAQKMHCSVMGHEALEDAIKKLENPKEEQDEREKDPGEKIVCTCFNISEKTIEQIINKKEVKTMDDVLSMTEASSGCGRCRSVIVKMLEKKLKNCKNLSQTQKILKINNIIEKIIAPELQKDGGDIELLDVVDNIVKVRLKGSCEGCRNSVLTLKNFVESTLKEQVCKNIEVIREE